MVKEPTVAEKIATLLDGMADEERRNALLAELATADEGYELFVDTAGVLREIEEEDAAAGAPEVRETDGTLTPVALHAEEAAAPDASARVVEEPAPPPVLEADDAAESTAPGADERVAGGPVLVESDGPAAPAGAGRETPTGVIPLRPRKPVVWQRPGVRWLAAAVLVAGIGLPIYRARTSGSGWDDPTHLTALSVNGERLPPGWDADSLRVWSATRGGGVVPRGIPVAGASAKVGTLHTDLEVIAQASGARDADAVARFANEAANTLGEINETMADHVAEDYRRIAQAAALPRPQLVSLLSTAREDAEQGIDADFFAAGAWAEAARLAALRRNAKFFRARVSARALEHAGTLPGLGDEGKKALQGLSDAQRGGEIHDWDAVAKHVHSLQEELVRALDPEPPEAPPAP